MTNTEMAYPPGLSLHGKHWRITKRVPETLRPHYDGKALLHYPTGTADKTAAALIAHRWLAGIAEEFARIRETGSAAKTAITAAEVSHLVASMVAHSLGRHEAELTKGASSALAPPSVTEGAMSFFREAAADAFSTGEARAFEPAADSWLETHGYTLDKDSEEYRGVLLKFAQGVGKALGGWKSRRAGEWVDTPPVPGPPTPAVPPAAGAPLLSAVVSAFTAKADKTKPMFKKTAPTLRLFLEVIGDKPVSALRQSDVDGFFALLCKLPPKWRDEQRKRGGTVSALAAMTWPKCIAPKTFEDSYMAALRPFLRDSRRLYGDQGFPLSLTTDGIGYTGTAKAGQDKQRALLPAELQRLFNGPECAAFAADPAQAHCYWLPLLGLYTGARVNEVCQLNPQCDILEEDGIWYLNITADSPAPKGVRKSVKNASSKRRVPVHSRLLALGFVAYVERVKAAGSALLFAAWSPSRGKASGTAEKWFGKHLRTLCLRDETPGARVVGSHCFRHTFLTRAHELDVTGAEALTGHTDTGTSAVVRGYRGARGLEKLQGILEQVTFDIDPPTPAH